MGDKVHGQKGNSPDHQIRTVADLDPWLKPYRHRLVERQRYLDYHEERILGDRSVSTFALGHLYYGLHRTKRDWVLREWAPNASQIYLICQATNWRDDPAYRLERLLGSDGDWEITTLCSFLLIGFTKTEEAIDHPFRQIDMSKLGGSAFQAAIE